MKNILTIDLEDWYQGIELPVSVWAQCEKRVAVGTELILNLLEEAAVRATFFVLGSIAESSPGLVKQIVAQGHEIASHGYHHEFVYKLTPSGFEQDLRKSLSLLEEITDARVRGYRAPYASITKEALWAHEILAAEGIEYSSSVFPIHNYRYGIPDSPRHPYSVHTDSGIVLEFPLSTNRIGNHNVAFTGGFYLRFFPYYLVRWAIRQINAEGLPAIVYLHPWEFDPEHPRARLPLRIKLTHYHNLGSTNRKLRALLRDFEFVRMGDVIPEYRHT